MRRSSRIAPVVREHPDRPSDREMAQVAGRHASASLRMSTLGWYKKDLQILLEAALAFAGDLVPRERERLVDDARFLSDSQLAMYARRQRHLNPNQISRARYREDIGMLLGYCRLLQEARLGLGVAPSGHPGQTPHGPMERRITAILALRDREALEALEATSLPPGTSHRLPSGGTVRPSYHDPTVLRR